MALLSRIFLMAAAGLQALAFQLPTPNRALLEPGGDPKYLVGTPGRPWTSGAFGCVRSGGAQMHEGLDIKAVQRDRAGEPLDPILAAAAGSVAYINTKSALSNYGKYIILQHSIDGLEVYTLYAHLGKIQPGLAPGKSVAAGQQIAVMGRTTNTRTPISKERAHLHFEINLLVQNRFITWYKQTFPTQRNDHGQWNGLNFLGLDPRAILLAEARDKNFNLAEYIRGQPELCRVFVRKTRFPWLQRYPQLVRRNPLAEKEGMAGCELVLNFNGVPIQVIPRAPSEIKGRRDLQVLSVNENELQKNPCRKLVVKRNDRWELGERGRQLITLITY